MIGSHTGRYRVNTVSIRILLRAGIPVRTVNQIKIINNLKCKVNKKEMELIREQFSRSLSRR